MKSALLLILALSLHALEHAPYSPMEGDLVIQSYPDNPLTVAIESCTSSVYSHCGIVVSTNGKTYILEANGPVMETDYAAWVKQGRGSKYAALRLKDAYVAKIPEFIKAARSHLGKPYDMKMDMDDEKIYCSELIFKAFKSVFQEDIGKTQKLGELNWKPNEEFIRAIENGGLPLDRVMITPRAVVESDKVTLVYSNY